MGRCKVNGCSVGSRGYKGPKFVRHLFPKEEFYKRQWCIAIGQDVSSIKDHDAICSKHFDEEDLEQPPDSQGRIPKIARPKKNAIPSLFLNLVS